MDDFLHMGGYARFVWPSYGIALAVLIWNVWSALRLHASALERALRRVAMDQSQTTEPASIHAPARTGEAP
ncbi:MAG TPA: heme exporter protein CcmD [Steroidobacteraceae bacterium]|nr:heme exporter protein CcmD [Steroidobacteraceae bacterium]